jgi:AbrB family looped-hinge helix DNA binding protein
MMHVTKVSAGGRVVIPAEFRKALGIKTGDEVLVHMEDGSLRLMTKEASRQWARDAVKQLVPPGVSLADELIRDRREEAARE